MRLESIPSGTRVFIDANIFIYHFTGVSTECSDFLNRCERRDLEGITSANVLLEVLHRLMMVEAVIKKMINNLKSRSVLGRDVFKGRLRLG